MIKALDYACWVMRTPDGAPFSDDMDPHSRARAGAEAYAAGAVVPSDPKEAARRSSYPADVTITVVALDREHIPGRTDIRMHNARGFGFTTTLDDPANPARKRMTFTAETDFHEQWVVETRDPEPSPA